MGTKVIEIHYLRSFEPPAPAVNLGIFIGAEKHSSVQVEALVDTGADITAIPTSVAATIPLVPVGRLLVQGITGERTLPTFGVHLRLGTNVIGPVEVILANFDFAVLGRDVLNHFRLILDGPELQGHLS